MGSPASDTPGLCPGCRHLRRVETPRSVFLLCQRSRDDDRYERYPRQPVLRCPGFEPLTHETPPGK
jgi:hypothetical protein